MGPLAHGLEVHGGIGKASSSATTRHTNGVAAHIPLLLHTPWWMKRGTCECIYICLCYMYYNSENIKHTHIEYTCTVKRESDVKVDAVLNANLVQGLSHNIDHSF